MGARLVSACFAMWSHLDHGPFRLLTAMALSALDEPSSNGRESGLSYLGEDALIELYGRKRSSMYEARRKLIDAGAITPLRPARKGNRAVYRLKLDPLPQGPGHPDPSGSGSSGRDGMETPAQGPAHPDPFGSGSPGRQGSGSPGRQGSGSPGPLGTKKEPRRNQTEDNLTPCATTDRARERKADAKEWARRAARGDNAPDERTADDDE